MEHIERQPATARRPAKKGLGDILIEENLITPEQLEAALEAQRQHGGRLSDILLEQGAIKTEQMAIVLSIQLNMPLIDLKRHTVQPRALALSRKRWPGNTPSYPWILSTTRCWWSWPTRRISAPWRTSRPGRDEGRGGPGHPGGHRAGHRPQLPLQRRHREAGRARSPRRKPAKPD